MKNPQETTTAILGSGGQFLFSPPDLAPSPTVLYDRHLSLAGKSRSARRASSSAR